VQGTAILNFIDLTISGTVYNDANGGTIDGTPINTATNGTAGGATLYANLVGTGTNAQVVATQAIGSNGTVGSYSFGYAQGVRPNTTYNVILSTTQGTVNSVAPSPLLPGGPAAANFWVNTGDAASTSNTTPVAADANRNGILDVTVGTTSVVNRNFGIERAPNSDNKSVTLNPAPTNGQYYTLDGSGTPPALTGSDPEDQTSSAVLNGKTVRITSLPFTTATPSTNNSSYAGDLYYAGAQITTGDDGVNPPSATNPRTITNFQGSSFQYRAVGGPGSGYTNATFRYAYVDAAGVPDGTPATYILNWNTPLPVEIVRFDAAAQGCNAKLSWQSGVEDPGSRYEVQYSQTGRADDFRTVATIAGKGSNSSYEGAYAQASGTGYYRLRTTDASADVTYSAIRTVRTSCGGSTLSLYPNPTTGAVTLEGVTAGAQIRVFDGGGRLVIATVATGSVHTVDLGAQAAGTYHVSVATEGAQPQTFQVVKR